MKENCIMSGLLGLSSSEAGAAARITSYGWGSIRRGLPIELFMMVCMHQVLHITRSASRTSSFDRRFFELICWGTSAELVECFETPTCIPCLHQFRCRNMEAFIGRLGEKETRPRCRKTFKPL